MATIITAPGAANPPHTTQSGFKVDISRGERIGRVSTEWFSRPDDERFLSLSALYSRVKERADRAATRTVETRSVRVEADRSDAERLALLIPGRGEPVVPTHWSFGQLASLVGAPSGYLRQLPAALAAINLQHGLLSHRGELMKTLETDDGRIELRAVTGPDYGRIWDHELVAAVMKIAGDGTGDTRWKVPGVLDWSTMTHNPFVEITKDTTTLYASDRDVFLFLVDDAHPIEAGRLPNGDPDLYFRGFYCWNSEVGSKTLGMASFYLRAVCMNRNIWGAEGFEEISIRHSKFAANRFAHEAAPALESFASSSPAPFITGIRAARERVVARSDDDRQSFLRKRGFSKADTDRIIATVLDEEGHPAASIFDFVQGIYPEANITKGQLADYYAAMAPVMLPWIGSRPISLVRCPQGRAKKCFFQKHDAGTFGEHIHHVGITEKDGHQEPYLYVDDPGGLMTCVQMGTIEFHGWGARIEDVEKADRLVFDLDPDEGLTFEAVRTAAFHFRDILKQIGLETFPMVTGGKGVHVIAPLVPQAEWPEVKDFAYRLAQAVAQSDPANFTSALPKVQRKGRIFVDYLRNQRGATAVMPFSARARPNAPVAVPITWKEMETIDMPAHFHIGDAAELVKRAGSKALAGWGRADQTLPDL